MKDIYECALHDHDTETLTSTIEGMREPRRVLCGGGGGSGPETATQCNSAEVGHLAQSLEALCVVSL